MCSPFAAQAALGATQGAGNFFIQDKAAKEQAEYQGEVAQATYEAVREDTVRKYSTLGRRSNEEKRAARQQIEQLSRNAATARGTVIATSGASGVSGGSVDTVLNDFRVQELVRIDAVEETLESTEANLADSKTSIEAEGTTRINNATGRPVQRPNPFMALLQIGSSAFSAYTQNSTVDPQTGDRRLDSF